MQQISAPLSAPPTRHIADVTFATSYNSAMLDAEVKALLKELKGGIEATAVGIIDGARGWLHSSSEPSPGTFWAAFTELDCLRGEWGDWDQELLVSGAAGITCRCGAHAVRSVMVHKRWIVVVLGEGRAHRRR